MQIRPAGGFSCTYLGPEYIGGSAPSDEWLHVACTYHQDGTIENYINGTLQNTHNSGLTFNFDVTNGSFISSSNTFAAGGQIDDVRVYDRVLDSTEMQQLYQMGAPVGSSTALPAGCPNIGDICDDGTVYVGLSVNGNVEMYTTVDDITGLAWNDGNTNYTTTGTTSTTAGEANTETIVVTDSDGVTSGFQTHNAAQYCYDLVAHGADDWYLPSGTSFGGSSELHTVINNGAASPNVNLGLDFYWASTENSSTNAQILNVDPATGVIGGGNFSKQQTSARTRCVRKGPAPRCANPYGIEGQMVYNTNGNVVQYCDGARWIAIGKEN